MNHAYSDNTGSKYSILIVIATAILLGIIFISLFTSSQILLHNSGLTLSDIFSDRDISITLNSTAAIVLGIATAFITISVIRLSAHFRMPLLKWTPYLRLSK